jgi:hypothetical protein
VSSLHYDPVLHSDDETWTYTSLPLCLVLGRLLNIVYKTLCFFLVCRSSPTTRLSWTQTRSWCVPFSPNASSTPPIKMNTNSAAHLMAAGLYYHLELPDNSQTVCIRHTSTSNTETHHYLQKDNHKKIQNKKYFLKITSPLWCDAM